MSVHFFVIAGDFWYASVLVDNGNASFAGVMQAFLGSCTLVWVRDRHWQTSWTASLW